MKKRITIVIAIILLVFALGLCGGVPVNPSAPKSNPQSSTLQHSFPAHTDNLPGFLLVAQHAR